MKIIIANWKMNFGVKESLDFLENFKRLTLSDKVETVIAPSFTALSAVSESLKNTKIKLAAQDIFWEDPPAGGGAFTGEIAPSMLKELGVTYVIIGHSERRHILGETNEIVAAKLLAAVQAGLIPILCVGETQAERESGKQEEVVRQQLKIGLSKLPATSYPMGRWPTGQIGKLPALVVAYEPVWAIGTGVPCEPKEANEMHQFIRRIINTKIIYGGSVNSDNVAALVAEKEIDGFLVGGASLDPKKFIAIIEACK